MATVITRAFENWQAQQTLNNLPARPDTVIFAHIPELDSSTEIDRNEGIPANELIVHQTDVAQFGVINDSAVAYSVVLDTSVGDFYFNWIGLVDSASNTLCMIVTFPVQQKTATNGSVQGNNITRTFTMEFNGAAEVSQINVTAQTWQIDFSARLGGIDEITRLANYDYYGHAAFASNGYTLVSEGDKYRVGAGLAYVGGIRALMTDGMLIDAGDKNLIYIDVSLQGSVLGAFKAIIYIGAKNSIDDLNNYTDPNGFIHYLAPLALITDSGIEDKRDAGPFDNDDVINSVNDAIALHEKSRNHPDATLTDKGFVKLSNEIFGQSESEAATPKAVNLSIALFIQSMTDHVNAADPHKKYLLIKNLLSAIVEMGPEGAATLITYLSLGNASQLNVGTTPGTVAAGDDVRIVNAVQSTNPDIKLPGSLNVAGGFLADSVNSSNNITVGGGAATLLWNGDIQGPVWGGDYLSNYVNKINTHGVVALARGAEVGIGQSPAPAGTFVSRAVVNPASSYARGLFMQRSTGQWVQMGGDI